MRMDIAMQLDQLPSAPGTVSVRERMCRLLSTHDLIHLRQSSHTWKKYLQETPEAWENSFVQWTIQPRNPFTLPPAAVSACSIDTTVVTMPTTVVAPSLTSFPLVLSSSHIMASTEMSSSSSSSNDSPVTSFNIVAKAVPFIRHLQISSRVTSTSSGFSFGITPSIVSATDTGTSNATNAPFTFKISPPSVDSSTPSVSLSSVSLSQPTITSSNPFTLIPDLVIEPSIGSSPSANILNPQLQPLVFTSVKKLTSGRKVRLSNNQRLASLNSSKPRLITAQDWSHLIYLQDLHRLILSNTNCFANPGEVFQQLFYLSNLKELEVEDPAFFTNPINIKLIGCLKLNRLAIHAEPQTVFQLSETELVEKYLIRFKVASLTEEWKFDETSRGLWVKFLKLEELDITAKYLRYNTKIVTNPPQLRILSLHSLPDGPPLSQGLLAGSDLFARLEHLSLEFRSFPSTVFQDLTTNSAQLLSLELIQLKPTRTKKIEEGSIQSYIHDDTWAPISENEWKQYQIRPTLTRPDQFGFYSSYFQRFEPTLIQVDHDEEDAVESDQHLMGDPTFAQSMTCMPEYADVSFEELRLNGEFASQAPATFEVTSHLDSIGDCMDESLTTSDPPAVGQCQSITCQPVYEYSSFEELRLYGESLARTPRPSQTTLSSINLTTLLFLSSTEMRQSLRYLKLDIGGRSYNYADTFEQLLYRFPNLLTVELGGVSMSRPMISTVTHPTTFTTPPSVLTESLQVTDVPTTTPSRMSWMGEGSSQHLPSRYDKAGWGGYDWTVSLKTFLTHGRWVSPIFELANLKWKASCSIFKMVDGTSGANKSGVDLGLNLTNEIELRESVKQIHQVRLQALLQTPITAFLGHDIPTVQVELGFHPCTLSRQEFNLSKGQVGILIAPKSEHWDAILQADQSFQARVIISPLLTYRPYQSRRNDHLLQQLLSPINLCADHRFDFIRKLKIYEGFKLTDYELELTKKFHQTSYYARMNEQRREIDPHPFWKRPHTQLEPLVHLPIQSKKSYEMKSKTDTETHFIKRPPIDNTVTDSAPGTNSVSFTRPITGGFNVIAGDVITLIGHYLTITQLLFMRHLSHHWSQSSRLPQSWSGTHFSADFGRWANLWNEVECIQHLVHTFPCLTSLKLPKTFTPKTDLAKMGELKYLQSITFQSAPDNVQFLVDLKNLTRLEFIRSGDQPSMYKELTQLIQPCGALSLSQLLFHGLGWDGRSIWQQLSLSSLAQGHLTVLKIQAFVNSTLPLGVDMTRFVMLEELQLYQALFAQKEFNQKLEYLSLKPIDFTRTSFLRIINECTSLVGLELFFPNHSHVRGDRFLPITPDEWIVYHQHHPHQPHLGFVNAARSTLIKEQNWSTPFNPLVSNELPDQMPIAGRPISYLQSITAQPEYESSSFEELRISGELACQQLPVEGKQIRIFESDEIDLMTLLTANDRLRKQLLYLRLQSDNQDIWPSPHDLHHTHLQLIHQFPSLITSQLNDRIMDELDSQRRFPWMRSTEPFSNDAAMTPIMNDAVSMITPLLPDGSSLLGGVNASGIGTNGSNHLRQQLRREPDDTYSKWLKKLQEKANSCSYNPTHHQQITK